MPSGARIALLTACALWAVSFVATKVALEAAPPMVVVSLRLLISAVCFLPWLMVAGGRGSDGTSWGIGGAVGWGRIVWLSLLGTGLHYGLQTVGLQYTTASRASLYAVTAPITILLLSALFLGERITRRKTLGVTLAVAGVLVVMGIDTLAALRLDANVIGDLLVLVSIVMWGLFTVFGKRAADQLGALRVTAVVTVIGALWMAPIGWIEMRRTGFSLARMQLDSWLAVAFLGVGCSFLATLLYFVALERTESQKVGVYLYTIPPMTAVVATLYLGEVISVELVVGAILVIAGVALTERG
ncbi:MAG: DMT family transporter [Thermoanaerobaculales bacterium]